MVFRSLALVQRFLCTVTILATCTWTAVGQQTQQAQNKDAEPARIEGVVVSTTGEAIPRADIRLTTINTQGNVTGEAAYRTTGRDDGTFAIPNIAAPVSGLALTARRPGYSTARYGSRTPRSPIVMFALAPGQVRKDIVLTMVPQGVITGTVTDEDDDPVQGAQVISLRYGYPNGQKQLLPVNFAQTNDLGEYRMANMPTGRHYLVARSNREAGGDSVVLPTFYLNTSDPQAATPIDITDGRELPGMDIQLLRGEGHTVSGMVVGAALNNAMVTVRVMPQAIADGEINSVVALARSAQVRPDGSFELRGVLPGLQVIQILVRGGAVPMQSGGTFPLTVGDEDIRDLVLPLNDGITITGSLRFEEDKAPGLDGLGLALGLAKGIQVARIPAIKADADGSFALEHLALGQYFLQRPTKGGIYIKAVRLNGADVTGSYLNLAAGGTMEIVLGQNAPDVKAVVHDEKGDPQGGLMVVMWPEKANDSIIYRGDRLISTDNNGAFTMETVTPGTYYVAPIEPIDNVPMLVREFTDLLQGEAVEIEVQEGVPMSLDLEMVPTPAVIKAAEKIP